VPAKSIAATTAVTATHLIIILEVYLDLQESAMKTLNLQFGMFCRYVKFGSKFCGSISWRKQWKQIRTAESQTIRLVVMILDRISD